VCVRAGVCARAWCGVVCVYINTLTWKCYWQHYETPCDTWFMYSSL